MIRRPPRSTQSRSSAASDVYKRQVEGLVALTGRGGSTPLSRNPNPASSRAEHAATPAGSRSALDAGLELREPRLRQSVQDELELIGKLGRGRSIGGVASQAGHD